MTPTQNLAQNSLVGLNLQFDFPLAPLTYFKMGGPAEVFVDVRELDEAVRVVKFCHEHQVKLSLLGGASNVIVADEGIQGLVMRISREKVVFSREKLNDLYLVTADAGVKMALLVSQVVNQGLSGLEYFLGVPGTLGGAVVNNSHYLQHLIGEYIHRVQVITRQGEVIWLTHDECDFAYDHSRFHASGEIVWQVEFALPAGDKAASQALIKEATLYRANTQPLGMPSSGCIFRNVPNTPELKVRFPQFADKSHISGGFLIDQAGLKGARIGQIEVSHKHAAFMVNHGGGTSADLKRLVEKVKSEVKDKFQINLQEEVFYLQ